MRACAVAKWLSLWLAWYIGGTDADLVLDYIEDPGSFHDKPVDVEGGMS